MECPRTLAASTHPGADQQDQLRSDMPIHAPACALQTFLGGLKVGRSDLCSSGWKLTAALRSCQSSFLDAAHSIWAAQGHILVHEV